MGHVNGSCQDNGRMNLERGLASPSRPLPSDGEQTVGQVHPNHPAALREGMRMGFDSPGQLSSIHAHLWKRTQVRLAARACPGGFGTCGP